MTTEPHPVSTREAFKPQSPYFGSILSPVGKISEPWQVPKWHPWVKEKNGQAKQKTKMKEPTEPTYPPLDPTSGEYFAIYFQEGKIHRHVGLGQSRFSHPLPPDLTLGAGVKLRRLDTGEIITKPIIYCQTLQPKVKYTDDLFNAVIYAETKCEIIPGKEVPRESDAKNEAATTAAENAKGNDRSGAKKQKPRRRSGALFDKQG